MKTAVIIGDGNAATVLARLLSGSSLQLTAIVSRNRSKGRRLASSLGVAHQDLPVQTEADYCIVAVSDHAIAEVVEQIETKNSLVCHISGATPMKELRRFRKHGVLYPLQTMSKSVPFRKGAPFFVEGSSDRCVRELMWLSRELGGIPERMSTANRLKLHLAAVLANNFSNHLFTLAEAICRSAGTDFSHLHPLIAETAAKAVKIGPGKAQTGPASRGDKVTMERHLKAIRSSELKKIYRLMSESISRSQ